jgi:GntR family transcriptional regulator/MocR family aminotransferase
VRVTGIAAGLHALLRLPPGEHEDALVARAARHGLAIEGLSDYRLGGGGPGEDRGRVGEDNGGAGEDSGGVGLDGGPALVVGYATPPGHAYSTAVARLCAVLSADG